jgi:hypothetical protein
LKLLQKGKEKKRSQDKFFASCNFLTQLLCAFGNAPKEEEQKILSRFALLCFACLLNPLNTKESLSCGSVQQP